MNDEQIKNYKVLGLINARGGSKRIPNKNVQNICGKPMIYYPIKSGLDSKYINKLIVSTDSKYIAGISKSFGADVPFIRPKELAGDNVSQFEPTEHAVKTLKEQGEDFDIVVLILCNTPFVTGENIDKMIEIIVENKNLDSVRSIAPVSVPSEWMAVFKDDKKLLIERYNSDVALSDNRFCHSDKLPERFELVGMVDVIWIDTILKKKNLFGDIVGGVVSSCLNSFDINTYDDLYIADLIMKDKIDRCQNWFKYYIKPKEIN